jgi:hypothetical protein
MNTSKPACFLFLILLLAACRPDGQAATEPTAVATGLPVATSTPTEPATPAPMATELLSPTPAPTATPAPTHTPVATPTTAPTATPVPTETPAPPEGFTLLPGPDIAYEGVSLRLDPALAGALYGETDELFGVPFTLLQFGVDGRPWEIGRLLIYPVDEVERHWGASGPDPAALRAALNNRTGDYFPVWGAHILLLARREHLQFQNGAGLRALNMTGQDMYWVHSESLRYEFHGLTADGRYYIILSHPIAAAILIDDANPTANPDAIPLPPLPDRQNDEWFNLVRNYNAEVAHQLDTLTAAAFTPDIALLDALVASLRVGPPE